MTKRITSKDIAELAGVSRTTVSFVLNNAPGMRIPEETRQRVLEAARQLNYHPNAAARSMVRGRTMVIGLVLCQYPEQVFADHFLPQALHGLAQSAATYGYRVMFEPIPPEARHDAYARLIRERHVDGIVVSGPRSDDEELMRIHTEGAAVVLMGQLPGAKIPSVDVDNVGGAALATRHLLKLGHRRIGLITNAPIVYTASADRLAGYRRALQEVGIAYDETLVRYGDFSPHGGEAAILDLLSSSNPPSAVFIASDTVALGAVQAIQRKGLQIPKDIAIVSFDDIPLINFVQPPLTTVRLPAYELGWSAADLLIRLIGGLEENPNLGLILETELVIRESCGARNENGTH
ncbi:MAG: LacI family DNA-binding transcriptional regulator [Anaerolineae bacterium]|nr:LacI family DNA-binding transcriptional regulator [Anaerolineae bacterium]